MQISWAEAFAGIGAEVKALAPKSVVFYTSGRASLEASYMYQLFARMYGRTIFPTVQTCATRARPSRFPRLSACRSARSSSKISHTDCMFFFGQNVGVNSPRMLHQLQAVRERGAPIITFNPLRERGLERFTNPQSPVQMLTLSETTISTQYHQLSPGGDLAAIVGLCKALIPGTMTRKTRALNACLMWISSRKHTSGYEEFEASTDDFEWSDIENLHRTEATGDRSRRYVYRIAKAVIACYGMGLTQHRSGVLAIQMLSNLLLMRGNIGKPGAGIFPVRGHSNVQGQRTVGITEKPELAPLDRLAEQYRLRTARELASIPLGPARHSRRYRKRVHRARWQFPARGARDRAMEKAWRKLHDGANPHQTQSGRGHSRTRRLIVALPRPN